MTLTTGAAAVHQAIVGDRLALSADHDLSRLVSGRRPLAHQALVWDIAIGQSTQATQFVRANLFYRGLIFRHFPSLDDTLRTRTEVVGLKQNRARAGRPRTGLVALHITTRDQQGAEILDFYRCAMVELHPDAPDTAHADDMSAIGEEPADFSTALADLDLAPFADHSRRTEVPSRGQQIQVAGGDVVSSAPELARLTLNVAQVHHDARAAGGRRLVYGGHAIGIAAAQASRALPGMLVILGWERCDHTGPVHEGDTLRSTLTVEDSAQFDTGFQIVQLRSSMTAESASQPSGAVEHTNVLDWRFRALICGSTVD